MIREIIENFMQTVQSIEHEGDTMTIADMNTILKAADAQIYPAAERNDNDGTSRGGVFSRIEQILDALQYLSQVLHAVVKQLDALQQQRDAQQQ